MGKIGLQIRATLENVDEVKTSHPDYSFFLKLKCSNCGEQSEKWHDITESEHVNEDSRNPNGFNFYMKCKLCSRENSIDIVEGSNGMHKQFTYELKFLSFDVNPFQCSILLLFVAVYTENDAGKFKTIVSFDCRGVEPVEFSPRTGWIVKASDGGQTFEDVDLSDDDWVEYDNKNKVSIGIYEFESNFIKLKK